MKNNAKLTLCAVMSALAVVIVLAAYFPYLTYALPAMAGLCIMVVLIEINAKWAFLTYLSSAIISFFIAESEAKLLFICIFGYYPILKALIEKLRNSVFEWVIKLIYFNATIILVYFLLSGLFAVSTEDFGILGQYGAYIFLGAANLVFVLYDICVSRMAMFYLYKLQPKISRVFKI
ncbi:MAG: hypothetical protein IKK24_07520 [Clostridia bacterium]|nr:hypothetical protein [Clostridia bacterium]